MKKYLAKFPKYRKATYRQKKTVLKKTKDFATEIKQIQIKKVRTDTTKIQEMAKQFDKD